MGDMMTLGSYPFVLHHETKMATTIGDSAATVASLWRFPVKSMQGEVVTTLDLRTSGAVGDRAYALIDVATGKVASAKSTKRFPNLLQCSAEFVAAPMPAQAAPPVRITLPDGSSIRSDDADCDARLSRSFGLEVRLARAAPDDYTIDQFHPDIEGVDPRGRRDEVVDQKLGAALFGAVGMPSPVPTGSFLDLFPLTAITTSTLARLQSLAPGSRIDARRFRMNAVLQTSSEGFVENGWVGMAIEFGKARLRVTLADPRCVMTTLAQGDLPNDTAVLRTLVQHNRLQTAFGQFPCAGVYASVEREGVVHVGDAVRVIL